MKGFSTSIVLLFLLCLDVSAQTLSGRLTLSGGLQIGNGTTASIGPAGISGGGHPAMDDGLVGPFASWTNVMGYGATGNGISDDTTAIQAALNELGLAGHSPVLFFPAGNYRTSRTLHLIQRSHCSLLTTNPNTTKITWAGTTTGPMLYIDRVNGLTVSGFNFFGTNALLTAIDESHTYNEIFDTRMMYSDNIFDVKGIGIRGGAYGLGFSEVAIERCHFISNALFGVTCENQNALDVWLWYNQFDWCGTPISNENHTYGQVAGMLSTNLDWRFDVMSNNVAIGDAADRAYVFTNITADRQVLFSVWNHTNTINVHWPDSIIWRGANPSDSTPPTVLAGGDITSYGFSTFGGQTNGFRVTRNSNSGGAWHSYYNIFRNSQDNDHFMGITVNCSIYGGYSSNSPHFFTAEYSQNPSLMPIVGCTVVNTVNEHNTVLGQDRKIAVLNGSQGPMLVMDCVFASSAAPDGYVVVSSGQFFPDLTTVSNTYAQTQAALAPDQIPGGTNYITVDEAYNPTITNVIWAPPEQPSFRSRSNSVVIEVTNPYSSFQIQAAVNTAATNYNGQRPIVHIPFGQHDASNTVRIPVCDLQLVGDGASEATNLVTGGPAFAWGTFIRWTNDLNTGPVFLCEGPGSKVTVRNMVISGGGGRGDCMVLTNVDQVGGRIYGDSVVFTTCFTNGLLVNGLTNAEVRLDNGGFYYLLGDTVSSFVKVHRGNAAAGAGKVKIFGTVASGANNYFDAGDAANLIVKDLWCEPGIQATNAAFLFVHDKATVTIESSKAATPFLTNAAGNFIARTNGRIAFSATNLNGKVTLNLLDLYDQVGLFGDCSNAKLLAHGLFNRIDKYNYISNYCSSGSADMRRWNSRKLHTEGVNGLGVPISAGTTNISNVGAVDGTFLKDMLQQGREQLNPNGFPSNSPILRPTGSGVTDIRMFNVTFYIGIRGLIINP